MMTKKEFKSRGGEWLAKVREWIKDHCFGGDMVTWGSDDVLKITITVKDLEDLAADIAYAVYKKYLPAIVLADAFRKDFRDSETTKINPARANLEHIKEIEAKGQKPILDEAGTVLGSY
jgi:hypothetical protein